MTRHLFLVAIALAGAAPVQAASRNFGITSFERIRVEGPLRVRLATGVAPYATATGSQAALDRLSFETMGTTLVVHNSRSSWGSASDSDDVGPVEVRIGTHDLGSAILTGAGSLQIDRVKGLSFDASAQGSGQLSIAAADVDQLSVGVVGTASAIVGGRAGTLKLSTRGVSSFDGSALATKDATIAADGASTVKANVTNSATVSGSGPATIILTGKPACTSSLSGAASIEGCKASR